MAAVLPTRLPDTASKAGFDELDPISMWFLGGSGTAGAQATGINDDARYGLDVKNVGAGGLALRATSGDAAYRLTINNSGIVMFGGIGVTGSGTFSSTVTASQLVSTIATAPPLVVGSTTRVTSLNADLLDGFHASNGSGAVPISNGTLNTNLNADLLDGSHASAFSLTTHTHAYLPLSGGTITSDLTVQGVLTTDSNVVLGNAGSDSVTVSGGLTVSGAATVAGNFSVSGNGLAVNASANTVRINRASSASTYDLSVGSNGIFTDGDLEAGGDLIIQGNARFFNSTGTGFTRSSWSGAFIFKDAGGTNRYVPYTNTAP